ncbi:hypothetical protein SPSYN_03024 [Sporotomaculum syntrophicum]|jgi:hypothetical protein|uniref:Uncharacterized protein n=1 Tax=Sporotomaculum syntrophicum TaxID=182264 RepID=A0A9D2WN03_9FIRM|nr:hypothetical protein [Sporotomaculum syntrophicum]KAF1083868.1 hypothetical protein SPSYN_03024 [Sporotomaculum syntrophicum]
MPYKDPEKNRAYHREYKRIQRAGGNQTPCQTALPLSFKLKTAQDVLNLIAEQIEAVKNDTDAGTLEKARCIGYLANTALKAVESVNIESRLAAVEQILKGRKAV